LRIPCNHAYRPVAFSCLTQSGEDLAELERASLEMGNITSEIEGMELRWLELAEIAGDL
jgi:hypothetical protein